MTARHAHWRNHALVLALLLLGFALRAWAPGQVPPGLYHDEAQHGLDALRVLEGHLPLYFAANNGREPLYVYLVAASVGVLGRSPLAVRLPALFAGALTLAATYDLARALFSRRVGRWALAVLAVTLWHVHLSRVGFRAVLLPLFIALTLAQAARGARTGKLAHWTAAGALYGATWYTYMAARFTPVVLATFALYALLFHRRRALDSWRGALAFAGAALLVLAPLGVYTLQHPDVVLARTGQVSVFSSEINAGDPWGTLARHALRTAEMFFARGDRIWRHNLAWRPVWGPALGLAFVLGVGVALAGARRHAGAALVLVWTALMALPTLLAEDAPHFLRGVGVLPTAALLPALGLAWITSAARRTRLARYAPLVALLLWGMDTAMTAVDYFVTYAEAPLTYHWFEGGPEELAGRINALAEEGWDGERMLHGPPSDRTVYVEPRLWHPWSSVPFLVPEENVTFEPPQGEADSRAFIVWPHEEWKPRVVPYLEHPSLLEVEQGPQAQGDEEPRPATIAVIVRSEPLPPLPEPVARFEEGINLRAAYVEPQGGELDAVLWWETEGKPDEAYTFFVHYLRDGEVIAQHDGQPGGGHLPTTTWEARDVFVDHHPLAGVTPDPTRDLLRVGLYRSDGGGHVSVLDWAGNPAGAWIDLPVVTEAP